MDYFHSLVHWKTGSKTLYILLLFLWRWPRWRRLRRWDLALIRAGCWCANFSLFVLVFIVVGSLTTWNAKSNAISSFPAGVSSEAATQQLRLLLQTAPLHFRHRERVFSLQFQQGAVSCVEIDMISTLRNNRRWSNAWTVQLTLVYLRFSCYTLTLCYSGQKQKQFWSSVHTKPALVP